MQISEKDIVTALCLRCGEDVQKRFKNTRVAVCGLGGLGSNISVLLARAGVGSLHLIDFDKVDISNLNRQQYFVSQIGQYKTEALKEIIYQINPFCSVETDTVKICENNVFDLLKNDEIVCEAFDVPEQKAMLVQNVRELFADKYLVSGSGMAGVSSANLIRTREVSKRFYICGDEKSDVADGIGLISSRVCVCASHQANQVLRIILGKTDA